MSYTAMHNQPFLYAIIRWDVDKTVKEAVKEKTTAITNGIKFSYESGFLFIALPSGRRLAYVKHRIVMHIFDNAKGQRITSEEIDGKRRSNEHTAEQDF